MADSRNSMIVIIMSEKYLIVDYGNNDFIVSINECLRNERMELLNYQTIIRMVFNEFVN